MVTVISYMYRTVENYLFFLFALRGAKYWLPQTNRGLLCFLLVANCFLRII